jgi:hypothetical protein
MRILWYAQMHAKKDLVESSLKMGMSLVMIPKILNNARNYATHDFELVSIVHALNVWRHYLIGNKFELRTNHSGMKYFFEKPTLNYRQTRWLEFLSEYDFDIKHIKGKENNFFDALSKRVQLCMLQPLACIIQI